MWILGLKGLTGKIISASQFACFQSAVSVKTRPALSKTFQDFRFFFHVNQTVTMASNPYLSNKGGINERKLQK